MAPAVDHAALDGALLSPADLGECALEHGLEISGIELGRRLIGHELPHVERHFLRGNEVSTPHICRIDAEISSCDID